MHTYMPLLLILPAPRLTHGTTLKHLVPCSDTSRTSKNLDFHPAKPPVPWSTHHSHSCKLNCLPLCVMTTGETLFECISILSRLKPHLSLALMHHTNSKTIRPFVRVPIIILSFSKNISTLKKRHDSILGHAISCLPSKFFHSQHLDVISYPRDSPALL